MKLFPTKCYAAELREDYRIAMLELTQNTDKTNSLVSDWTKKSFRGQVNEKGFKLISSEIGRGAVCVLIGDFKGKNGRIDIRIHNVFKVLFSILLTYPFIGFGIIAFDRGVENAVDFLPVFLMLLLFVRFVFIELSFRFISKTGYKKLIRILGVVKIHKN